MTKTDYPIYTDDGKLFCKKVVGENGEQILEGPNKTRITFANLSEQVYNPVHISVERREDFARGGVNVSPCSA